MKTHIFKIIAVLLMLTGSFLSCVTKNEIDMSEIDFSNIENLYAQPLPVLQKCVQGKWEWYESCGGVAGCQYVDNTFVEINDDHCIIEYADGTQRTIYFTWKKLYVDSRDYKTYVLWENERNKGFWYFQSIKNDSLSVGSFFAPGEFPHHSGNGFVRNK